MRKIPVLLICFLATLTSNAQNDLDVLLRAGVEDAQRFANDYLAPGTNGLMYSMNSNWFNTADAKPLGGFEISIIANAASVKNENKSFLMNTNQYNNIEFVNGSNSQTVSSVLGENNPDLNVLITDGNTGLTQQITLPSGIGSGNVNLIPTAFIQGALGLVKGIEVKARFVPKIKTDEVSLSMYGAGVQFEVTKWLPADKILPIA